MTQAQYGPLDRKAAYSFLEYALPRIEVVSAKMFGGRTQPNTGRFLFRQYAKKAFSEPEKWQGYLDSPFWRWALSRQSGINYCAPLSLPTDSSALLNTLISQTSGYLIDGPLKEKNGFYFSMSRSEEGVALAIRFKQEASSGSGNTSWERNPLTGRPKAWNFDSGFSEERRRDFLLEGHIDAAVHQEFQRRLS